MPVTKISGALLKKMVTNGAVNLKNCYAEVDALNVFPVPDGDTGTNMSMTMMAGIREIENVSSKQIVQILKNLSRGLLMGARGNSGVILSQFFRGVYDSLKTITKDYISLTEFASALYGGYKMAYKAVMSPVEGTILTVVKDAAHAINGKAFATLEDLVDAYLVAAKESLANTPKLLPILAEAGVVDSGGAGFVKIVEGMQMMLNGEKLHIQTDEEKAKAKEQEQQEIKFGYCTEFIVELAEPDKFIESELKEKLNEMGDSLVLVRDENLLKVHVHVNKPGEVLNIAQSLGEIVTTKIENMRLQHTQFIEPKKQEHKEIGIISVCFGEGIKKAFTELGTDYIIDGGQTMNPSTEQFLEAINNIDADGYIIIPNNSNIIMAAKQAQQLVTDKKVVVLEAKSIATGYSALINFDPELSIEENYENMSEVITSVKSGEVTYAVRDTEINGVKINSGDFMSLSGKTIYSSTKERIDAIKSLIDGLVDKDAEIVTLFYGADVTEDEVNEVTDYINEIDDEIEIEIIEGKQDIYSYIVSVE